MGCIWEGEGRPLRTHPGLPHAAHLSSGGSDPPAGPPTAPRGPEQGMTAFRKVPAREEMGAQCPEDPIPQHRATRSILHSPTRRTLDASLPRVKGRTVSGWWRPLSPGADDDCPVEGTGVLWCVTAYIVMSIVPEVMSTMAARVLLGPGVGSSMG